MREMNMSLLSLDPGADGVFWAAYAEYVQDNPSTWDYPQDRQIADADRAGRRAVKRYAKERGIVITDPY